MTFGSLFGRERSAAKDRGALVHRWLEMIEWIDDGLPDQAEMVAAAVGILRDPVVVQALLSDFSRWTQEPRIRSLLSRSAFPTGARVDRELSFLVRDGGGLLEGRVDRLIRTEADGGPRLLIVDWKTDEVSASDGGALARTALYRPQLEAYRRAVALVERVPAERIDACVAYVHTGEVMELPHAAGNAEPT
jgi:ATP-dependent exoDNAse (exonuclease V) beta subunit